MESLFNILDVIMIGACIIMATALVTVYVVGTINILVEKIGGKK